MEQQGLEESIETARRAIASMRGEMVECRAAWQRALDRDESEAIGSAGVEWTALAEHASSALEDAGEIEQLDETTLAMILSPEFVAIARQQEYAGSVESNAAYHDPTDYKVNQGYHREEYREGMARAREEYREAELLIDALVAREVTKAARDGVDEAIVMRLMDTARGAEDVLARLGHACRRTLEAASRFATLREAFDDALPAADEQ